MIRKIISLFVILFFVSLVSVLLPSRVSAASINEVISNRKLTIKSVPPKNEEEVFVLSAIVGNMYNNYYIIADSCNYNYTKCYLGQNGSNNGPWEIEITYEYDSRIKEKVDKLLKNKFHTNEYDEVQYILTDTDMIDYLYYSNSNKIVVASNYSSELRDAIENENLNVTMYARLGGGDPFLSEIGGLTAFYYKGTNYSFIYTMHFLAKYVVYVDDNEEDIQSALKTRLSKYYPISDVKKSGDTISDFLASESSVQSEEDMNWYYNNPDAIEHFLLEAEDDLYNIEFTNGKTIKVAVVKDSSKIKNKDIITTRDVDTYMKVDVVNTKLPPDTHLVVNSLVGTSRYTEIGTALTLTDYEAYDIRLKSDLINSNVSAINESSTIDIPLKNHFNSSNVKLYYVYDGNSNQTENLELERFDTYVRSNLKLGTYVLSNESSIVQKYNVSFDTQGGSAIDSQLIYSGDYAYRPSYNPTKEGYTFDDWYVDSDYSAKFNFNSQTITSDTTIYAKWNQITPVITINPNNNINQKVYLPIASGSDWTIESFSSYGFASPEHMYFDGWTIGDEVYQPGDIYENITNDLIANAQWRNMTDISSASFSSIFSVTYDGTQHKPSITVRDRNTNTYLVEGTDYEIQYGENINAGTGYVTVNGIGKYYGSKVLTFEIRRGTIVYDSSSSWVDYDGNEHGISINVTSPDVTIKYADENGDYSLSEMPMYVNVGTYTINFELSGDNYNARYGNKTVTIRQVNYSNYRQCNTQDYSVTYDGNEHGLTLSCPDKSIKIAYYNSETGDYDLSDSPRYIESGTYGILYKLYVSDNYYDYKSSATLAIGRATLVDNTKDKTVSYDGKEYGIDLDYKYPLGTIPTDVTIRYGDAKGNYTLNEMPKYKDVGSYTIKYYIYGNNYYEFYGRKTLVITKGNFDFNCNSKDVDTVYDGNEHWINATADSPTGLSTTIKYADANGNYVLTESPRYTDVGTYTVKYQLSINNNYNTLEGTNTIKITKANIKDDTKNQIVIFDEKDHQLALNINATNSTIKYADSNGNYNLDESPKYKDVGNYTIKYKITSNNYNDYTGEKTLSIHGIQSFDLTLKVKDSFLIVRDYINVIKTLQERIKFLATSHVWKHLDSSKKEITDETFKTGNYIRLNIDNAKYFDYQLVILGDANGDGEISALDYVKIKNHIMGDKVITEPIYLISADINEDDEISALDYVRIKNYIMNGGA